MKIQDFDTEVRIDSLTYPEDIASATETNADVYVTTAGKGKIFAVGVVASLTSTKTAVCQLTCASDASGTGKADVSGKTLTLTGGTSSCGWIAFRVEDLDIDNSKIFVGVDITTNQNGDNICAFLVSQPDHLYSGLNPN